MADSGLSGSERKQLVVLRWLVLVLLLVVAGLAAVVFRQRQPISQIRQSTRSRELARSATEQAGADPELAILLALEAVKTARTPQAEEALRLSLTTYPLRAILGQDAKGVNSATFSPDGKLVATAGEGGRAGLWDAATGNRLFELKHTDAVYAAAFRPDGKYVVTVSRDTFADVWDTATGALVKQIPCQTRDMYWVMFSPDGRLLVTPGSDNTPRIWSAETWKPLATANGHTSVPLGASFSRDGKQFVTYSSDHTARVWEATGKAVSVFRGHLTPLNSADWSPDGRTIVTAADCSGGVDCDPIVRIWEAATGKIVTGLVGPTTRVHAAAFNRDGRFVVTVSDDQAIRVWNVQDGTLLTESRGHKGPVLWIRFSPDGTSFVTASQDATARLWSFAPEEKTPGALLSGAELRGHRGWVKTAVYSPDSKSIVTASADGTARVWDLGNTAERIQKMAVPELVELARKRVTRELTPEERSKYALD